MKRNILTTKQNTCSGSDRDRDSGSVSVSGNVSGSGSRGSTGGGGSSSSSSVNGVSCGNKDTCRLTTGIRSEKCVVKRFRRCANVIQCTYANQDSTV